MTRQIVEICAPLGIGVRDPVVVSKDRHASLRGLKLM
jgi:DNA repair protein RadC